jgi:hypothetical protein
LHQNQPLRGVAGGAANHRSAPLTDPAAKPKLASGLKPIYAGERAFVLPSLAAELPWKTRPRYDELVSGRTVYTYVNNDPIDESDPTGLLTVNCTANVDAGEVSCQSVQDGKKDLTVNVTVIKDGKTETQSHTYSSVFVAETGSARSIVEAQIEKDSGAKIVRPSISEQFDNGARAVMAGVGLGGMLRGKSAGSMQKQVERDQAPQEVDRVDKGRGPYEKDHVALKDGRSLNYDGTWKHGGGTVSNAVRDWLVKNGWTPPQ